MAGIGQLVADQRPASAAQLHLQALSQSSHRAQQLQAMQRKTVDTATVPGPQAVTKPGAPVQRRAATASELALTDSGETGALFDARLDTAKVFTKEVPVTSHDASTVIAAYTNQIRPIGNVAAAFTGYTDQVMNAPPVPLVYPQVPPAGFDAGLVTGMGMSTTGVAKVRAKSKDAVQTWLGAATTQPEMNTNSKDFAWVDPFLVELTFKSSLKGHRPWTISTQFAHSGTGYIVKIKNGERDLTGTIKTAGDFANLENEEANNKNEYAFSSTHDQSDEMFSNKVRGLGKHEEGDTKGSKEHGLDAITWLAAEGARFQPVKALSDVAKPGTEFYMKPNNGNWTGARSATLSWLMVNWGGVFGKAYDIAPATIAVGMTGATLGNGLTRIDHVPAGARYNLTKEKREG